MHILLVDDDAELCGLLTEFLKREGFTVECAHEGHLGLEKAAQQGVDLVVLDVMLPASTVSKSSAVCAGKARFR